MGMNEIFRFFSSVGIDFRRDFSFRSCTHSERQYSFY